MTVGIQHGFDDERESYPRGAGRAGYSTECHSPAVDPPFVYDADDGVVEDQESGYGVKGKMSEDVVFIIYL